MKYQHVDISGLTQGSLHTSKNTPRAPQNSPRTPPKIHLRFWCHLGPPRDPQGPPILVLAGAHSQAKPEHFARSLQLRDPWRQFLLDSYQQIRSEAQIGPAECATRLNVCIYIDLCMYISTNEHIYIYIYTYIYVYIQGSRAPGSCTISDCIVVGR